MFERCQPGLFSAIDDIDTVINYTLFYFYFEVNAIIDT